MDIQNIKTIVRKELSQYYNNVSSYVVLMVFVLLWEFLFFRSAILVGEASLRMLYDLLPWVMLLLVPAVTMGIISREKDEGTLELLLTQPITDLELIVGKWIASLIFLSSALLFAIPIAFFMSMYGAFDWGMFGGQLTGSILFAGVFAAVGIFVSTLFATQIAALLVTVFVGFLLIVIGTELVTANLPLVVVPVFERLSFLSHLSSMSRGVIDTRDVWYFISVVIMFLGLTYLLFMKRKYGNVKAKYASFQTGIALFIGIMVLTNVLGERIPGRLDLTAGRLYTLSNGTKKILKELPDVVSISLYASGRLPPQYTPVIRETKDLLRDVKTTGGDNVQVSLFDPSSNASIATEATSKGVREVQFNVIGQEEFQVKTGFMGLAVEYAGATETIPFIQQTDDLEYQLTSMIRKLTIKDKKQISFLSGHGEKELASDMQTLNTEITKLFTVTSETEVATNAAALVVAAPMQKYDSALIARMNEFINQKKNVLFLVEGYEISPQLPTAAPSENNLNDLLKPYGVGVDQNVVYDLRAHEVVNFGGGAQGVSYLLPYPFWMRVSPVQGSPFAGKVDSVLVPWASSITVDEKKAEEAGYTVQKLLITTQFAGEKTGSFSTIPDDTTFPKDNLGEKVVGVALAPKDATSTKGKLILVGDSDFATDQMLQNSRDGNLTFTLSLLSWLAEDDVVSSIAPKTAVTGKLLFRNDFDPLFLKYGTMALSFILPAAYGLWRLTRRRNLRTLVYTSHE